MVGNTLIPTTELESTELIVQALFSSFYWTRSI